MVAGAIAGQVREHHLAYVQAIGAGAVNQAVKAIIVARGFLQGDGLDLVCVPQFVTAEAGGLERSAIQIVVQVRGAQTALSRPTRGESSSEE